MNLFLLSKHFTPEVNERFLEIVGKKPEDIKIAFSQNAADQKDYPDGEVPPYVQIAIDELEGFGFQIEMLDLCDYYGETDKLVEKLKTFDAAFFTGGMYLVLLDAFYKSDLVDRYAELVKDGLVHIGFSAGGMIMSDNMKYYEEFYLLEDYQGKKYEKGIGLFPHYLFPHYSNKPKYAGIFQRTVKRYLDDKVKFIPLENHQAVHATEDDWEII